MSELLGKYRSNLWVCVLVVAVAGGTISCGTENAPASSVPETMVEVSIGVKLSKLAASTMVRAEVVVSAADMDTITVGLEIVGDVASGTIRGIPVGSNRQFTINGYDSADLLAYSGTAGADVAPGESTNPVTIILKRVIQDIPSPSVLAFEGQGNGTTGTVSLEKGVYTITIDKNQDVSVSVELLDADTGNKVLFSLSPLMSSEGFGQAQLAKAFVVAQGNYIFNISSSSSLGDWRIAIAETVVSSGSLPLAFTGEGNGSTDIFVLENGGHTITIGKEANVSISAHLLNAVTGAEMLFSFSPLMRFEGFGQTQVKKGFVVTSGGQFVINIESSSSLGPWTMTLE